MKKIIAILIASILFAPSCSAAETEVKLKPCSKSQLNKTKNGLECRLVNKLYRWYPVKQNVVIPSPVPTTNKQSTVDSYFQDSCDIDPNVPEEWRVYQDFAFKNFQCARFYKYVNAPSKISKLDSGITSTSQLSSPSYCKLASVNSDRINPSISANIQIVPIGFTDRNSTSSPLTDYKKYFDFISDYYSNTADVKYQIKFDVPQNYINIGKPYSSYNLKDSNQLREFMFESHKVSDQYINFSNADMTIIVLPLSIDPGSMMKFVSMLWINTNEKTIKNSYISVPPVMTDKGSWFGVEPTLWVLEIAHFIGLPDRHGDDKPFFQGRAGAGSWGITGRIGSDFLMWDRWSASMINDSQIRCITNKSNSFHWITASTIKGNYEKAISIKINNNVAIFIESIRPYGYNYKLPKGSHGVLVYVVDVSANQHGAGVDVINKPGSPLYKNNFGFPNATLQKGESLDIMGYRIVVKDSNSFGDLVEVIGL